MKRIGIVGLCLAAVFAFSAMIASSASAAEYGVCVKAAKSGKTYTGKYNDKNCTEANEASTGKYEWSPYPGPAGTKWGYTDKSKSSTLLTIQGSITCTKDKSKGTITGPTTNVDEVVFEDCTNNVFKTACYNVEATKGGKKGGTIIVAVDTHLTEPAPGVVLNWASTSGLIAPIAGLEFLGSPVAVFYCVTPLGEDPFFVYGELGNVQTGDINLMSKKAKDEAGESVGVQGLTTFTVGLESKEVEPFVSTQIATEEIKDESKTEVKA